MAEAKGLRELQNKLATLDRKVAGKTLRSSALLATTPLIQQLKKNAPRGKKMHRTYKGNLVAPGFTSRSIARKAQYKNGVARVDVGVKAEAYYSLQFVEKGTKPHRIPKKGSKTMSFGGRTVRSVNHPGTRPRPWLKPTFIASERPMLNRLAEQLRRKLEKL